MRPWWVVLVSRSGCEGVGIDCSETKVQISPEKSLPRSPVLASSFWVLRKRAFSKDFLSLRKALFAHPLLQMSR